MGIATFVVDSFGSRGGQVALYSALEPARRSVLDDALRFVAHVALYPSCSIPYHARQVTGAPILMLLGTADDYTPPQLCRAYADWFRGRVRRCTYLNMPAPITPSTSRPATLAARASKCQGMQRRGRCRDRHHAPAGWGIVRDVRPGIALTEAYRRGIDALPR